MVAGPMPARTETAVLLVAGLGSRLGPEAQGLPKALIGLTDEETILGRALRLLRDYGVRRVVFATGYRKDAIVAASSGLGLETAYAHNERFATTQNAASLRGCERYLGPDEAFFKLDGDLVFDPEVLPRLDVGGGELLAAVDDRRVLDAEAMKVRADSEGSILAFGKGIPIDRADGESIGIERVSARASPVLFAALAAASAEQRFQLYYEDVYSELIAENALEARLVRVGDLAWTEVDTPEDLARARALMRPHRS